MELTKLTPEQIKLIEEEKSIEYILSRITDWHKPKEVNPKMLARVLYEILTTLQKTI